MFDAFQAPEPIRKGSKRCCIAANGDQFKAHICPEMDVRRRDDALLGLVLDFHEPLRESVSMMVVEQGNHADNFAFLVPFIVDQLSSNGITNRLGATGVAAFSSHAVESGNKLLFHGYAETNCVIQVTPLRDS